MFGLLSWFGTVDLGLVGSHVLVWLIQVKFGIVCCHGLVWCLLLPESGLCVGPGNCPKPQWWLHALRIVQLNRTKLNNNYQTIKLGFCGGTGIFVHYCTDQHRTGTDNGQWFCVYWFIRGNKQIYIQDR